MFQVDFYKATEVDMTINVVIVPHAQLLYDIIITNII